MSIYTQSSDTQARILFPGKVHHAEWLLISASFYPAIMYYLQRIRDFGLCLCTCSVCGKIYLAESLHHSLCSEACRIAQGRKKKRFNGKIITKSDRKAFQDWMFAQEQEYEQFFTALGN